LRAALWKSRAPTPLALFKCGRLYRSAHTRAFEIVLSETNLAETRKDRLDVLTDMLAHARIFVPNDLALDAEWRSKTHAAVEAAANEGGLAAEVRDLLKEVLADVQIVEDPNFKRRADRALAEYDGIVKPGQNIVYEYRWQAADGCVYRKPDPY
jgi:hypothetical protein